MIKKYFILSAAILVLFLYPLTSYALNMDLQLIGDAGNQNDSTGYGGVDHEYWIGKYEVTNTEYTEFLNAVAASDPHNLYNTNMAGSEGGITRSGSSGSYAYSAKAGWENKPVVWVSWYDATRFANWMMTGNTEGTSVTGAYDTTNHGAPYSDDVAAHNAGATVWVTTEDEWYKAAYYDQTLNSGSGDYYLYPTMSNTIDTSMANYNDVIGEPVDVGSYSYPSYYGTYDQAANALEWTEAFFNPGSPGNHALRGGIFSTAASTVASTHREENDPDYECRCRTFRIVTVNTDQDSDGYPAATDCDDNDPNTNPGATEIPGNCTDDDCNAATSDGSYNGDRLLECLDDSPGSTGTNTSIAVDSSDDLHISYYNKYNGNETIKYATDSSGAWVLTSMKLMNYDLSYAEGTSSIAIDSQDKAHISFFGDISTGSHNDGVNYASNASGSWVFEQIVGGVEEAGDSSIALDSLDKVHISSHDNFADLKYSTNGSGSWDIQVLAGGAGLNNSIAIDSQDKAHISFFDYSDEANYALKYTTNTSGSWVTSTVDDSGIRPGRYNSIAIGSLDKAHISYYDSRSYTFKYATNTTGTWVSQTLDNVGSLGGYNDIAIDPYGNIHISYYDGNTANLKYATNTSGS